MILMLYDYHNIHATKVPQKLGTSTAVHMASSLLDIHMDIPAVAKTSQAPLHHPVPVFLEGQVNVCHGRIASEVIKSITVDALRGMCLSFTLNTPFFREADPRLFD